MYALSKNLIISKKYDKFVPTILFFLQKVKNLVVIYYVLMMLDLNKNNQLKRHKLFWTWKFILDILKIKIKIKIRSKCK